MDNARVNSDYEWDEQFVPKFPATLNIRITWVNKSSVNKSWINKTPSLRLDLRNLEMEAEHLHDRDGHGGVSLILQDVEVRSHAIALWNVRISLP
jgi:hypothetical protein